MFGWRKRSEGFEWREYVRTTVLIRRADRQRRIEDVRLSAFEAVKAQRDRGVEAGRAKLKAATGATTSAAGKFCSAVIGLIQRAFSVLWSCLAMSFAKAKSAVRPVSLPGLTPGLAFARHVAGWISDIPHIVPFGRKHLAYAVAGLTMIAVLGPMLRGELPTTPASIKLANLLPASFETAAITGRASALTGDMLRVNGELVRLQGIEAPGPAHPCFKSNGRRWPCGAAATAALSGLLRGRSISCQMSGVADAGLRVATCRSGDIDLAAELARTGKVFATSAYGNEESAAREAHAGIWQNDTVRPEKWREQVWEEAKRSAPDGCPIKGIVRSAARVYAMPWSDGYERERVRQSRGGRWFCNEAEARAAGFSLRDRS